MTKTLGGKCLLNDSMKNWLRFERIMHFVTTPDYIDPEYGYSKIGLDQKYFTFPEIIYSTFFTTTCDSVQIESDIPDC